MIVVLIHITVNLEGASSSIMIPGQVDYIITGVACAVVVGGGVAIGVAAVVAHCWWGWWPIVGIVHLECCTRVVVVHQARLELTVLLVLLLVAIVDTLACNRW